MKTSKRFSYQNLAIIIVAVLLALSTIINFTMAYFTDSKTATVKDVTLKFGYISVKPSIKELSTSQTVESGNVLKFNLTADEVARDDVYKTLELSNTTANRSENYYVRIKFSFYNGGSVSNLATIKIADSALFWTNTNSAYKDNVTDFLSSYWRTGTDGKVYCDKEIVLNSADGGILSQYIPLHIHFSKDFNQDNLSNAYVQIEIEAIQSANKGYESWNSTAPSNWPN